MDVLERDAAARLTAIKARLRQIQSSAAALMWDYGTLLAEIHRDDLWRLDGAESFSDWARDRAGMSHVSAYKAMAVATHFSREMAERFGSEKLALTVDYVNETRREEQPGDVLALTFRRQANTGGFESVPFAEATCALIEDNLKLIRSSKRAAAEARKPAAEPHIRERAVALARALPPPPKGVVRGERIAVKKTRDGRTTLTFQAIPVDELEQFIEALRQHLLDAE